MFDMYQTNHYTSNGTMTERSLAYRLHEIFMNKIFINNPVKQSYKNEGQEEKERNTYLLTPYIQDLLLKNGVTLDTIMHMTLVFNWFKSDYDKRKFNSKIVKGKVKFNDFFGRQYKNDIITYLKLIDTLSKGTYSKKWMSFESKEFPELRFNAKIKKSDKKVFITPINTQYAEQIDIENKVETQIIEINKPSFILGLGEPILGKQEINNEELTSVEEVIIVIDDDVDASEVERLAKEISKYDPFGSLNDPDRSMDMVSKEDAMNIVKDLIGDNAKLIFDKNY